MNTEQSVPSPRKILIVDDTLVVQITVAQALKKSGYQVLVAGDISTALNILRREKPDLILLDLGFPVDPENVGGAGQDGFTVVELLRRMPEAEKIPLIMIISGTDPAKYQQLISGKGIVACFQKPLKHSELLAAVDTALGGKSTDSNG